MSNENHFQQLSDDFEAAKREFLVAAAKKFPIGSVVVSLTTTNGPWLEGIVCAPPDITGLLGVYPIKPASACSVGLLSVHANTVACQTTRFDDGHGAELVEHFPEATRKLACAEQDLRMLINDKFPVGTCVVAVKAEWWLEARVRRLCSHPDYELGLEITAHSPACVKEPAKAVRYISRNYREIDLKPLADDRAVTAWLHNGAEMPEACRT